MNFRESEVEAEKLVIVTDAKCTHKYSYRFDKDTT